jgi:hypothetical protein
MHFNALESRNRGCHQQFEYCDELIIWLDRSRAKAKAQKLLSWPAAQLRGCMSACLTNRMKLCVAGLSWAVRAVTTPK